MLVFLTNTDTGIGDHNFDSHVVIIFVFQHSAYYYVTHLSKFYSITDQVGKNLTKLQNVTVQLQRDIIVNHWYQIEIFFTLRLPNGRQRLRFICNRDR